MTSQSSFISANDPRLHFGLGAEKTVDVDVRWPLGATDHFKGVAADQLATIREGPETGQASIRLQSFSRS